MSLEADSTDDATVFWSMGFTIRRMNWVMHWLRTSWSSLPGRWLISPTPMPNFRPSDRTVFSWRAETTRSAPSPPGAKWWASSISTKAG